MKKRKINLPELTFNTREKLLGLRAVDKAFMIDFIYSNEHLKDFICDVHRLAFGKDTINLMILFERLRLIADVPNLRTCDVEVFKKFTKKDIKTRDRLINLFEDLEAFEGQEYLNVITEIIEKNKKGEKDKA